MPDNNYCYRCGQALGTHDDGECAGVKRAMEFAAMRIPVIREPQVEIAKRLNEMASLAILAKIPADWDFILETLIGVEEMATLEKFKMENVQRAKGQR